MNNKIGIGIITCNRRDFFEQVVRSIPDNIGDIVVVNDGLPYPSSSYPSYVKEVIQHTSNKSVGISKNEALRWMIQHDCEHLFLIEDDILVKDPKVFERYIQAASVSGIWHLCFGYHGPANMRNGQPTARYVIEYPDNISIALNQHSVGAFCYFLRGVIKNVGYIDERLKNAFDHPEHTYRIIKAGLHPAWWWFADLGDSYNYLTELASSEVNSTIRGRPDWQKNIQEAAAWFKYLHGYYPTQIPDTPLEEVLKQLKEIHTKYARPIKENS